MRCPLGHSLYVKPQILNEKMHRLNIGNSIVCYIIFTCNFKWTSHASVAYVVSIVSLLLLTSFKKQHAYIQ